MNQSEFRIVTNMKKFILSLDSLIDNFPKKEKVLKDKIKSVSYDILELIFLANLKEEKLEIQKEILNKISMLDFYLETSFKKKIY